MRFMLTERKAGASFDQIADLIAYRLEQQTAH
jgi:hypothetical protein